MPPATPPGPPDLGPPSPAGGLPPGRGGGLEGGKRGGRAVNGISKAKKSIKKKDEKKKLISLAQVQIYEGE